MLIDDFMPVYDFSEKHETIVRASAADIYRTMNRVDFSESFIIRWLLKLRGLSGKEVTLRSLKNTKFNVLAERKNEEVLIGLAGQFWKPTGNMEDVDAGNFREFDTPGYAKATWNFTLEPGGAGASLAGTDSTCLKTETRIQCMDAKSRSSFGFYWTFIQPYSGWIRTEMLRIVKKTAEDNSAAV